MYAIVPVSLRVVTAGSRPIPDNVAQTTSPRPPASDDERHRQEYIVRSVAVLELQAVVPRRTLNPEVSDFIPHAGLPPDLTSQDLIARMVQTKVARAAVLEVREHLLTFRFAMEAGTKVD